MKFPTLFTDCQATIAAFPKPISSNANVNFPAINSDALANPSNLVADNIMEFGYYEAAKIARKQKKCFTLFYFLAFGRAPRF